MHVLGFNDLMQCKCLLKHAKISFPYSIICTCTIKPNVV